MSAQPSWYATQPAWYDEATEPTLGRDDEGDNLGDGLDDGMFYDDDDDQLD
jgi:hypothetical protein